MALNFVIEPELEADVGEEVQKLLEQMQEDDPEERPLLQVQKAPILYSTSLFLHNEALPKSEKSLQDLYCNDIQGEILRTFMDDCFWNKQQKLPKIKKLLMMESWDI